MSSPSSRPTKRKRKNQNKQEDDEREGDSTTTAPIDDSHNVMEKEKNKKMTSPLVVFAHGAGAPCSSDWMIRWQEMLAKGLQAVEVTSLVEKRGAPPKAEKLVDFHAEVVKKAVAKYPGHPLILAGKSMGSRVSCMVAGGEEGIGASAVVCLGYPLKGMNGAVRDETLLKLTVPTIFLQGSKDGLCPLEKLELVRKKMKSVTGLHVIEGGDHSFKIAKKHLQSEGSTQEEAEDHAVRAIAAFVSKHIRGR
ncbi:alpha/beta-Hydrolases superfamily protein [Actinidia rufa]|uniref:Alpha/beta-Hydrolases superfamily protein n=1 Tax=Actinidia rufa TaxID=165716 RepID=A0A7J0FRD3_9ERIC|nr:alpha/beta-Hydrolases superfamily protein [Actinidia rufa]